MQSRTYESILQKMHILVHNVDFRLRLGLEKRGNSYWRQVLRLHNDRPLNAKFVTIVNFLVKITTAKKETFLKNCVFPPNGDDFNIM